MISTHLIQWQVESVFLYRLLYKLELNLLYNRIENYLGQLWKFRGNIFS